ncbi:MAG: pentapeptide repeat-containing protein [Hyphomicrobiales bacterium]|nr:pentapeptide repeat-containing protein [Hyphomicrobiales bacterium]
MAETLLTPSSIKLYGRLVKGLNFDSGFTHSFGGNYFLHRQFVATGTLTVTVSTANANPTITLSDDDRPSIGALQSGQAVSGDANVIPANATITSVNDKKFQFDLSARARATRTSTSITITTGPANFARIYAFSFEGAIYSMPKPAIFLVHGTGTTIDVSTARVRSSVDDSGVAAREWEFSGGGTVSYWEYEKGDFSLRLDTEAGPLEQILLAAAIRGADMADRSGANLGIRSGANLSGANLSGANLSGANLSGANLRNR